MYVLRKVDNDWPLSSSSLLSSSSSKDPKSVCLKRVFRKYSFKNVNGWLHELVVTFYVSETFMRH